MLWMLNKILRCLKLSIMKMRKALSFSHLPTYTICLDYDSPFLFRSPLKTIPIRRLEMRGWRLIYRK